MKNEAPTCCTITIFLGGGGGGGAEVVTPSRPTPLYEQLCLYPPLFYEMFGRIP